MMGAVDVILASQSPRRKELLRRLFPEFRVIPSGVDERLLDQTDPVFFVREAAEAKARDIGMQYPESLVIAADTIVCLDGVIFGKPADRDDARGMLEQLAGRRHRVLTGVALFRAADDRLIVSYETTFVTFKALSRGDIETYLDRNDFADKAGSYAIQDVGETFVETLEGDYDNVVGFPLGRVKKMVKEFKAPEYDLTVTGIAFPKSWPVGRIGESDILVPGAVVGDAVRVRIVNRKPKAGKITKLLEPSPWRTAAACPHFGICGGCAYQNLEYGKQIELKEDYLRRVLEKSGPPGAADVLEPIIPSPALFGYRNKMEFSFAGHGGDLRLGLRERSLPMGKSRKRTVGLQTCPLFGPAADRILPAAGAFADADGRPAFDPMSKKGFFRNLILREAKGTGEVMVILVTRSGELPGLAAWAENLQADIPAVRSIWHIQNDRNADVVEFEKSTLLAGAAAIEEELGGLNFRIHPDSFFQPNPRGAAVFYELIAGRAREIGARKALGLFCGAGAIEMFLAGAVEDVVGVDSEAANIRNAEENAASNGINNVRFIQGLVEKSLTGDDLKNADLIVLDPPRDGLRPESLAGIPALRARNLIYMSCNPASFARDVFGLAASGYRPERIFAADFFPHTPHFEVLGFLTR
jgi:23S rRNA (uracil1939-C5)-methyltransferase